MICRVEKSLSVRFTTKVLSKEDLRSCMFNIIFHASLRIYFFPLKHNTYF